MWEVVSTESAPAGTVVRLEHTDGRRAEHVSYHEDAEAAAAEALAVARP